MNTAALNAMSTTVLARVSGVEPDEDKIWKEHPVVDVLSPQCTQSEMTPQSGIHKRDDAPVVSVEDVYGVVGHEKYIRNRSHAGCSYCQ